MLDCMIRRAKAERYREADVYDVAREVVRSVRLFESRVALFVHPSNFAEIVQADGRTFSSIVAKAPQSLVGVYAPGVTVDEVAQDIAAMPRNESGAT